MGNILSAIKSIVSASSLDVIEESNEIIHNRANQMGDAFEDYVKNAFANCLGQSVRDINPTLPFAPRFLRCISSLTMAVCVTVYYRFCLS